MSFGSRDAALVMAAWTSWAAASMFRSRVNVSVICVNPRPLLETMESSPAIVVNWRSEGSPPCALPPRPLLRVPLGARHKPELPVGHDVIPGENSFPDDRAALE